MGNKSRLVSFVISSLQRYGLFRPGTNVVHSVADLFAGTGVMAREFANQPGVRRVWANDQEPYAAVLCRARLVNEPDLARLQGRFDAYNAAVDGGDARNVGFIETHYAGGERPLFSESDASAIDALRSVIPTKDVVALAALLEGALRCSNGLGKMNSAFRRARMDRRRSKFSLHLPQPLGAPRGVRCRVTQKDVRSIRMPKVDLVYIDPPYTQTPYAVYYNVLNTIVLGDSPATKGQYHIRADASWSSDFASTQRAEAVFSELFAKCARACRILCMSYSTQATLSLPTLRRLLETAGFHRICVYRKAVPKYGANRQCVAQSARADVWELLLVASAPAAEQHVGESLA